MWGTRWGETAPVHRHEEFLAFENTSTGEATNHLSRRPQDLNASQHAQSVAMNGSDSHPTRPGFPHSLPRRVRRSTHPIDRCPRELTIVEW